MRLIGFSFFILTVLLFSCGQDSEDKILHQAHDVHLEAFKIKQSVKPQIEQLLQRSNSIQVQGRSLTEEEIKFTDEVNNLSQKFSYWEENHLEVPGFGHEGHDHSGHDHDHSHDHSPAFNLPASDVLLLQKEFKDSIVAVQQQVQLLLRQ
jgi:hypothetical protein